PSIVHLLEGDIARYDLTVRAGSFAGKPMVQIHRLVYAAIAHLMDGDLALVHAIDRLRTLAG
ncbi:MAG: BolA/IbaG family iron-sulfur metabolism protein, partial [Deltaproteobacteria bacterium]|nr:BolA/IbaG family iron-sulfur metabolism protein [Deltaproteobacteria bacterium]